MHFAGASVTLHWLAGLRPHSYALHCIVKQFLSFVAIPLLPWSLSPFALQLEIIAVSVKGAPEPPPVDPKAKAPAKKSATKAATKKAAPKKAAKKKA